jgi:hypothetical protein
MANQQDQHDLQMGSQASLQSLDTEQLQAVTGGVKLYEKLSAKLSGCLTCIGLAKPKVQESVSSRPQRMNPFESISDYKDASSFEREERRDDNHYTH